MNKIKKYRELNRLSIRQLAKKSNVSFGHICDLENNRKINPTKDTMDKIAEALGKTVPEIFYSGKK